jgi:TDG/mug DNA glycosylase family protein
MPSEASLAKEQYYGHPRNAFWPLICALFAERYREDYAARKDMLIRHGVALWDVVAKCEREGSGDAAIHSVTVNDFPAFFTAHPAIGHVFFNGGKAYELYKKHVGLTENGLIYDRLGSTSPVHAISFEARMKDWKRLIKHLREETHP